jgi:hypothetical protein
VKSLDRVADLFLSIGGKEEVEYGNMIIYSSVRREDANRGERCHGKRPEIVRVVNTAIAETHQIIGESVILRSPYQL